MSIATTNRSYFDNVASQIAKPRGHTLKESIIHFEHTWSFHFDKSFPRASPRNTGKGPGLLDLPPELRLRIYHHLNTGRQFLCGAEDEEIVDTASLLVWEKIPASEHKARKNWSWVLTHPLIFKESVDMILHHHGVKFRSAEDIDRSLSYLQPVRYIVLNLGDEITCEAAQQAMRSLKDLPNLEHLNINIAPSTLTHFRLPAPTSGFKSLRRLRLRNVADEIEERKEMNEKELELETLDRKRAEAKERLEAWSESRDGGPLGLMDQLAQMELKMAVAETTFASFDLSLVRATSRWNQPRAVARRERQRLMRREQHRLRKDLGLEIWKALC